ncbi:MAG: hypothetical protein KGJ07_07045 [Patescibacteria group bacterium]|nr:hypothetical protein [Patescibacteria group bacterium]MDE2588241.1 hypothetical protein [Patescibacteria group bacterium]
MMHHKTNPKKHILFPTLPYDNWHDSLDTLHMWTQIVGKIKLRQNSFINHWWEVALFVTSRGLTTGRIPYGNSAFEISFDFVSYKLIIVTSNEREKIIPLEPCSVSDFYKECMLALNSLNIRININTIPSEVENPIPFEKDTKHRSYDGDYVKKWHTIQLQSSFILDEFRASFRGKSSPVQFFWGSFDLNSTRFSGKKLPDKLDWPKGYKFMRFAENEENYSHGFWPGNEKFPQPAFYAYLYPAPNGCENMNTGPLFSYFDTKLAECIFPYEEARKSKDPKKEILHFFQTTYNEYAKLAGWNIKQLQGSIPVS